MAHRPPIMIYKSFEVRFKQKSEINLRRNRLTLPYIVKGAKIFNIFSIQDINRYLIKNNSY